MNKQEAIEKIKNIETLNINDIIAGQSTDMVIKNQVLDIISQIDEPQKVVVPKSVAEWMKKYKEKGYQLAHALEKVFDDAKLSLYIKQQDGDYTEVIAKAWLSYPNITVEQEKLYTVEIPNNGGTLVLASIRYAIQLVDSNKHFPGKFTKESIEEAGFGWVFDCDGVKVVEVE